MVNKYYSVAKPPVAQGSFDLADLGTHVKRNTGYGYLRNGRLVGFDEFDVPVSAGDYDGAFIVKLASIKPPHQIRDYISHHFEHFLSKYEQGLEFVLHIEHNILPGVKRSQAPVCGAMVEEWIRTQKAIMLSEHKQQRTAFLEEAYKAACEHAPGRPMSVSIDPTALGEELNLDRSAVSRIVTELVQDGFVTSTLGMKSMLVTREGVRYLEGVNEPKHLMQQNFHFNQGSTNNVATGANSLQVSNTGQGAQFNVASGDNANQTVNGALAASLPELVEQLKQVLAAEPKLEPYRPEIEDELQRIDLQLQRAEPKKSILSRSFESLNDLVKDAIGSTAGHAAFALLEQVPDLLAGVAG